MLRIIMALAIVLFSVTATAQISLDWEKHPNNPALAPPALYGSPVWHADTLFLLYTPNNNYQVNLGWSSDTGKTWTLGGKVYDQEVASCGAVDREGDVFYLYYAFNDGIGWNRIRRAYSTDLRNWTAEGKDLVYEPTPINQVSQPGVFRSADDSLRMIYERGGTLRLATYNPFNDLWIQHPANPIITAGGSPDGSDDYQAKGPGYVVFIDGLYYIFYSGRAIPNWQICWATSPDLTNWTKHGAVFSPEEAQPWEGSHTSYPLGTMIGNTLYLFYSDYPDAWSSVGCATASLSMEMNFDIKPASCPNPLNLQSYLLGVDENTGSGSAGKREPDGARPSAVFPAAILGTADFDVADIDPTSLALAGVSPIRFSHEDVAMPMGADAGECECNEVGPDGYTDLTLKFYRDDIIAALGEVYDGDMVPLTLSGNLYDGTPIEGSDCVWIVNGPEAPEGPLAEETPVLVGNHPNPFNPTTQIGFSLPHATDVRLVVYNVMGQEVTVLADGRFEAGAHAVEWNGCDATGRPAASGVYLYRLETEAFSETKKMLLLK